jgi:zinc protease
MKRIYLFLIMGFILIGSQSFGQGLQNLQQYQLANGLTVILNEDHSKPEVFGYVTCKAGGKDDPSDATGMAHYMEHMLFKGTTDLGTTNWEKEKVHIDSIFGLYDLLGQTTDETKRKMIQQEINNQSVLANEYAIPNELSNIINEMGGTGMNANTSSDRTVFFNSFPPNQIQPWLELYGHRFQDAVFRSFQSELEVVYEEKNMYSDMFFMSLLEKFQSSFFKKHPYGQQSVIGTIDNLKNPSLTKMYEFYKTWYVPNNMALVLCGDFSSDQVKPMIEQAFGSWKSKPLPEKKHWDEQPFNGREFVQVNMTPVKLGVLGFRTPAVGSPDELALKVCQGILSNESGSGLLDQLALNNQLLGAQVFTFPYYDYGMTVMLFIPKIIGQNLENAEKLLMEKVELVKNGEFDDWRVEAIKKELYRQHQQSMEENNYRGEKIGECFAQGFSLDKLKSYPEMINAVTKEDIIRVAKEYYGDNYLAFYSKMGSVKNPKIEKPGYKPVVSNTTAKSEFAKKLDSIPVLDYVPKYLDFDNDITDISIQNGVKLYTNKNLQNDIFSLKIKFKAGEKEIPMLKYAGQLMAMAFTNEYKKDELKNEYAKIGATYEVSTDESYTTITLYGIETDLDRALYLINGIINNATVAQKDVTTLLEGEKANRKLERAEPEAVADALFDWIWYGNKSDYIDRLTLKEISKLNADSLTQAFHKATQFEVELHYSGKLNPQDVKASIVRNLKFADNLKPNDVPIIKPIQEYNENTIIFVDKKKALQSKIYFLQNGSPVSIEQTPAIEAFNLYFGGGFSGLVLQEIREYRSLAYGAGAAYRIPQRSDAPAYFVGHLATQADKTGEALDVFMDLLRNMPEKKERMKMINSYLALSSVTSRPGFRDLSSYVLNLKQKGYRDDPAKIFSQTYQNMQFDEILRFYNENIKNRPTVIAIVGNQKNIDMKKLESFGKLIIVKEKALYRN